MRIAVPLSKLLDLGRQEHQHYILGQAAANLNVPLSTLMDLSDRQRRLNKKPRLNPSTPMSASYSEDPASLEGHEKSPLAGPPGRAANDARKPFEGFAEGFSSGWTGSRLAECLASFSMCPPCSKYEPHYSLFPRRVIRQQYVANNPSRHINRSL